MTDVELPKMVATFLGLFRGETDDKIKSDMIQLDANCNGQIDLNEFIRIVRIAVCNNFTNVNDLIVHINSFKRERYTKKKVLFYEIVLNYKLNDDFTAGDKDKNEAFMAQFKSSIAFLDTDLNGKVNLDELVKAVRRNESITEIQPTMAMPTNGITMNADMRRASVNYVDGVPIFDAL